MKKQNPTGALTAPTPGIISRALNTIIRALHNWIMPAEGEIRNEADRWQYYTMLSVCLMLITPVWYIGFTAAVYCAIRAAKAEKKESNKPGKEDNHGR